MKSFGNTKKSLCVIPFLRALPNRWLNDMIEPAALRVFFEQHYDLLYVPLYSFVKNDGTYHKTISL